MYAYAFLCWCNFLNISDQNCEKTFERLKSIRPNITRKPYEKPTSICRLTLVRLKSDKMQNIKTVLLSLWSFPTLSIIWIWNYSLNGDGVLSCICNSNFLFLLRLPSFWKENVLWMNCWLSLGIFSHWTTHSLRNNVLCQHSIEQNGANKQAKRNWIYKNRINS